MQPQYSNEQLFRILIEEGFSKGDITVFDKHTSKDFIEHQYGFIPPDVESVKKAILSLHRAFSDFSLVIDDVVVTDDKVWGRMTGRGTQTGQFGPMPPTGKKIEITVIDIMRFKEGKLIEHWGIPDRLAAMEQLGMKPPPKLLMKLMTRFS
ncbi:MAG TPA: ester cyclase [Bacteroidales bacterium]|jgi:predicted ester cyclase|nr:ester cyclase [Bacteroidales bacterium]